MFEHSSSEHVFSVRSSPTLLFPLLPDVLRTFFLFPEQKCLCKCPSLQDSFWFGSFSGITISLSSFQQIALFEPDRQHGNAWNVCGTGVELFLLVSARNVDRLVIFNSCKAHSCAAYSAYQLQVWKIHHCHVSCKTLVWGNRILFDFFCLRCLPCPAQE